MPRLRPSRRDRFRFRDLPLFLEYDPKKLQTFWLRSCVWVKIMRRNKHFDSAD
jgi:hypothetical protein